MAEHLDRLLGVRILTLGCVCQLCDLKRVTHLVSPQCSHLLNGYNKRVYLLLSPGGLLDTAYKAQSLA